MFVGVSWPYANGDLHLGHLAGQNITCDVFARYYRLRGNDVLMVSGSDSHGTPVVFKAEELEITPEKFAAESHEKIVETFRQLGLVYENYTKTTTENHKEVVQNIFLVLKELGYLEEKKSKQYYDPEVKRFLPDRYVKGTCPECGNTEARGDECPQCGAYLEPEQLIDPYSSLPDAKPVLKETNHFYLNLKKVQGKLAPWVEKTSPNWRHWVAQTARGWIKEGLEPRPVTRDMNYGIKVPVEGWDDKVIYVWIEAVVGYLSAAIEWAEKQGDISLWEEFWKDPKVQHFYFVAGGNVPFHTILWPAEIVAYNEKYESEELFEKYPLPGETEKKALDLPYDVPANRMLLFKGKKMSKGDSTGVTVKDLIDNYNPDIIRYFFVRYAPENSDREYTWKDFIDANNNELVANIGNFINRTLTFTKNNFEGKVPSGDIDPEVQKEIDRAFKNTSKHIEKAEFVKAVESIMELGHFANKYFNDQEPWVTVKDERAKAEQTIFNSIQLVSTFNTLIRPLLPFSGKKLHKILNLPERYEPTDEVAEKGRVSQYVDQWAFREIAGEHELGTPEILFEKLEYTDELRETDESGREDGAKDVAFSNEVSEIPVIHRSFHNLAVKKRSSVTDRWVKDMEEKIKTKYGPQWRSTKALKGYKDLYNGFSDEDFESAPEHLIEFVLEKGGLPNINTVVDVYNAVSAFTGVSIGAHDISKIEGEVKLKVLDDDVKFVTIAEGEPSTAKKGEYAYVDSYGILCRLDIKQGQRTKVTEDTTNLLILMQGHKDLPKERLEEAMELLEEGLNLV